MPSLINAVLDYSDIPYAASFRDAPDYVQAAIMGSWPIDHWGEAAAVIFAESGNRPDAHNTNGEDSRGLMQINVGPGAHPEMASLNLFDPVINCRKGYEIFQRAGYSWRPWSTAGGLGLA